MTEHMDAIDSAQQREIDHLKSIMANLIWVFALFALIQFGSMVLFWQQVSKECPHKDCNHHSSE